MESPGRPTWSDLIVAGAITVIAQAETWTSESFDPKPGFAAAALGITLPLVWRRVAPIPVLALIFVPLFAMTLMDNRLDAAYIMLALIAAFTAVGSYSANRRQAAVGLGIGLTLLAVLFGLEAATASEADDPTPFGDFVFVGGIIGAFWALAVALRERSLRTEALEDARSGSSASARSARARRWPRSARGSRASSTTWSPTRSASSPSRPAQCGGACATNTRPRQRSWPPPSGPPARRSPRCAACWACCARITTTSR